MTTYVSDPRKATSPECETMAQVRYEIDRLDRLLVQLIKERQSYMDAAARIKADRGLVRDEARIEDVVRKVLKESKKLDLSAEIAEPVWRTMIEACIDYEFKSFDGLRKS